MRECYERTWSGPPAVPSEIRRVYETFGSGGSAAGPAASARAPGFPGRASPIGIAVSATIANNFKKHLLGRTRFLIICLPVIFGSAKSYAIGRLDTHSGLGILHGPTG